MTFFSLEINGNYSQDSAESWSELCNRISGGLHAKIQEHWFREISIINQRALGGSIMELHQLAQELKIAGHRLNVVGAAASSTVFYALGLCPICPLDYGFYLERFIDPSVEAPAQEIELIGMVSQSGLEFLQQLRKRNYKIRVSKGMTCINGQDETMETIEAQKFVDAGGCPIQLSIATPSVLSLANFLTAEESQGCLGDSKTWELIRDGGTGDIDGMEDPEFQNVLRTRKPGKLDELAAAMTACLPGRDKECERVPVYQEDLMKILHLETGIQLRECYQLVRPVVSGNLKAVDLAKQKLFGMARMNGIPDGDIQNIWDRISAKCFQAPCKAYIYSNAFYSLQAACFKVHYPEEFRAAVTALRSVNKN